VQRVTLMITPPRDASLDDVGEENYFRLKHIKSERERSLPWRVNGRIVLFR
jgi:hypothetical protein